MKKDIPIQLKPHIFEAKWQKKWEEAGIYSPDMKNAKPFGKGHLTELSRNPQGKKPYYNLMMFPYPSAEGLHIGNMYAFTGVDVHGRYMRMRGFDVFEPIGLDGFGIHSENYALKVNHHPKQQAKVTEANFYRQLRLIGNSFDWTRTVETYDPDYYRWTQWLFVQMFKHGLAYRGKAKVNWCPSCKTVLADEQVIDGKCERCSTVVIKKELEQWFFKITAYVERLLQNTYKDSFNWTEKVKIGQRNWIGKKEGIIISYQLSADSQQQLGKNYTLDCFTTRPDTNFGATFIVMSPEQPLCEKITTHENYQNVKEYIEKSKKISREDRISETTQKTGVFTGAFAINQLNGYRMPIWISDFVLMDVGTGAVVGVPGHDKRDFEFATAFNIPIVRVVVGNDGDASPINRVEQVQEEEGTMINSEFLNGLDIHEATQKIMDYMEEKRWGKRVVTYHLRDWLISRQRYWGAPIPMVYCQKCAAEGESWFTTEEKSKLIGNSIQSMAGWYPVPEDQLPVLLPDVKDWKPTGTGRGPLAGHPEFYKTTCPHCGSSAQRETDVCDTFLDSSWYYLRYSNAEIQNSKFKIQSQTEGLIEVPWDPQVAKKWFPIDSYIGGAEHTVLHLLYTRFVWMALRDWGYLVPAEPQKGEHFSSDEPFKRFFAHGLIIKDGAKMSKSKGNVVIPDEYIKLYGADTLRTYLMFLGPFNMGGDFRDSGIAGMYRWLSRVWRLVNSFANKQANNIDKDYTDGQKMLAKTIKSVSAELEALRFNTAIAKLMEFTNWWVDHPSQMTSQIAKDFLKLLAPFAPHLTEELWQKLKLLKSEHTKLDIEVETGKSAIVDIETNASIYPASEFSPFDSIHIQPWPTYDPLLVAEDIVTVVVQVNGKIRDSLEMTIQNAKDQGVVEQTARESANVKKWLSDNQVKKIVFISAKLINFVV